MGSLAIGVDNIHHDVFLSPKFVQGARDYLFDLIRQSTSATYFSGIELRAQRPPDTGAFRKPREINWFVGCLLLFLTIFAAFSGYLLPYDAFSVTATGIGYGMVVSIPWIGPTLANFVFAGKFPVLGTIPRFYGYHVMLIPLLLLGLMALHLIVMIKQKHIEPGYNRGKVAPGQLLGIPLWPQQATLMLELFLLMTAGLFLLASAFPQGLDAHDADHAIVDLELLTEHKRLVREEELITDAVDDDRVWLPERILRHAK